MVTRQTPKIGDFGLAAVKEAAVHVSVESGMHPAGSVLWMAPEVIRMKGENPYSFKSDVYSYGVVLYELLSYALPYSNMNNIDAILYMVGTGALKPDFSILLESTNKMLVQLCKRCVEFLPDVRPPFREVVSTVSKASYIVPIIARTTSCLHHSAENSLNVSQSSLNLVKNSYLMPSYVNNLKAYSAHNINTEL